MTTLTHQVWGNTSSGEEVKLFTLRNARGTEVTVTDFGGRIVSIKTADKNGQFADIALGCEDLSGYLKKNPYLGASVGRYANRIAGGRFTLDGNEYTLARNNGENSLHGGLVGFDKVVWSHRHVELEDGTALELTHVSKDGEEGYPGTLTAIVLFRLTDADELNLDYSATTDKPTVLNLTNHSYFDLRGEKAGEILGHEVMINADSFTPVNEHLIPTGELKPVAGTPFDFRTPSRIGARIDEADEQLKLALGYDHNFVLNGTGLRLAARVTDPVSGRVLEVQTTQPGIQFYTGNHLDGTVTGKGGAKYEFRFGFCLETQHFPDSPNQPEFPSTQLRPGQLFHQQTIFKFSTSRN